MMSRFFRKNTHSSPTSSAMNNQRSPTSSAMDPPKSPKRFALLIGIDLYLNTGSRKLENEAIVSLSNLDGCVNDVHVIQELLRVRYDLHEPSVLTSSPTSSHPSCPQEPEDRLPTFDNIKREIDNVSTQACAGDLFFIHFSGHGAPLARTSKSPEGRETDLSLMTADYCCGKPALRGWQLNEWLENLNEMKIQVIVVLDSCHSGGAWRTGNKFRSPENWKAPTNLPADEDAVREATGRRKTRGAELGASWDINPEGFTLMAACQNDQLAAESTRDGKVNGAFTLALHKYFDTRPDTISSTYYTIRQYIASEIHPQVPQVFGRDRLTFFGQDEPFLATPLHAQVQGSTATLLVGKVHGIKNGAQYIACYPTSQTVLSVYEVDEFESQAKILYAPAGFESRTIKVFPRRWSAESPFKILVDRHLGQNFETELRIHLAEKIAGNIDVVTFADASDQRYLGTAAFRLHAVDQGGIEVSGPSALLGYSGPVRSLRIMAANHAELAAHSSVPLAHLFRFGQILDLQSEASRDTAPFSVALHPSGEPHEAPFKEKQRFKYIFQNSNDNEETLYFTVLILGSGFDVMQLFPASDSSEPVLPGKTRSFQFNLTVADKLKNDEMARPEQQFRDIIRTVVTAGRQLSFRSMELPEIWDADKLDYRKTVGNPRGGYCSEDLRWWIQDNEMFTKLGPV